MPASAVAGRYYTRRAPSWNRTPRPPYRLNRDHPLARNLWGFWIFNGDGSFRGPGASTGLQHVAKNLVGPWDNAQAVIDASASGGSQRGIGLRPHGGVGLWFNILGQFTSAQFTDMPDAGWLNCFAGDWRTGTPQPNASGGDVKGTVHLTYYGWQNASLNQDLISDPPLSSLIIRRNWDASTTFISGMGFGGVTFDLPHTPEDRLTATTYSFNEFGRESFCIDNGHVVSLGSRGAITFPNGDNKRLGPWRGAVFSLALWSDRALRPMEALQLHDPANAWPLIEEVRPRAWFDLHVVSELPTASGVLDGTGDVWGFATEADQGIGFVDGSAELTGDATLVLGASGALEGAGDVVGLATEPDQGLGAINGSAELTGSATGTQRGAGVADGAGDVVGLATLQDDAVGVVNGSGELAGLAIVPAQVSGALEGAGDVVGFGTDVDQGAGFLTGTGDVVGVASIVAAAVGAANGAANVTGSAETLTTATGTLQGRGEVVGRASSPQRTAGTLAGAGNATGLATQPGEALANIRYPILRPGPRGFALEPAP